MDSQSQPDQILTVDEVAAFLKVEKKTVYKLIARGELIAKKVLRDWRVQFSDVQNFLNQGRSA
jgi:excisionase family DNA binding protein